MKQRKVKTEIKLEQKGQWPLSTFGSKTPFLYWSHILFDKDIGGELNGWTLIVELEKAPDANADSNRATIYFMSPDAPKPYLFEVGARFELVCGKSHFGHGVITSIFEDESKKSDNSSL